jgi:FkbM family methyltransferase
MPKEGPFNSCLICGSTALRDITTNLNFGINIIQCTACTFVQSEFVSDRGLESYYRHFYRPQLNEQGLAVHRQKGLEQAKSQIAYLRAQRPGLKVSTALDYGTAEGSLGHELRGIADRVFVTEMDPQFVALLKNDPQLTFVEHKELAAGSFDGFFDVACISHVLEHLTDPYQVMDMFASVLKPGGLLLVDIPNEVRMLRRGFMALGHLSFFTTKSFAQFVDVHGCFDMVEMRTCNREVDVYIDSGFTAPEDYSIAVAKDGSVIRALLQNRPPEARRRRRVHAFDEAALLNEYSARILHFYKLTEALKGRVAQLEEESQKPQAARLLQQQLQQAQQTERPQQPQQSPQRAPTSGPSTGSRTQATEKSAAGIEVAKPPARLTPSIVDVIGYPPDLSPIKIVDVGANPLTGSKGPYQMLVDNGLASLAGFEPDPASFARLEAIKGPRETYYPVAVGDGKRHQLRICAMSGMNSLLPPNFDLLNLVHFHGIWAQVHSLLDVDTKRLDDIPEIEAMDYLKIDIQGGELMVFESAAEKLKDCLVVHTEAMFVPMYEGQPLFSEQELFLRQFGLQVHKFFEVQGHVLKPFAVRGDSHGPLSQLFWADVIFIKDITHLDRLRPEQLLKLAIILHDVYKSVDVAHLVLQAYDRVAHTTMAPKYQAFLTQVPQAA